MANMTVASPKEIPGSKLKSITFTHTAAGTATGTVASPPITGTLLRVYTDAGGDAAWDLTISASSPVIWARTGMGTGAETFPLGIMWDAGRPAADTEVAMWGIPVVGEAITVATANMSGSGTGPAITIIYRED